MPRIILLKTQSSPHDPYDTAFRERTALDPVFVPVLQHQRVAEEELAALIRDSPHRKFSALIITSQRAVEALSVAMEILNGPLSGF
jgi:uroporphyrinogen-III synthase